jgi:hypothetical protein
MSRPVFAVDIPQMGKELLTDFNEVNTEFDGVSKTENKVIVI